MTTPAAPLSGLAGRFLALHHGDRPLLQPNAHDVGTARLLESLGFEAIATTSGGFAATLGRIDGGVTRDETLAHAAHLAAAVGIPVAADTEHCYADDPAGAAETVRPERVTWGGSARWCDRRRDLEAAQCAWVDLGPDLHAPPAQRWGGAGSSSEWGWVLFRRLWKRQPPCPLSWVV